MVKNFRSKEKADHWLDHSKEKFGETLVSDVKSTLKVLIIFIPLPIFFTLYDQQGSGWTFQANRMDGRLGSLTILPDQMQVVNPFLILIFIPLFTYIIYPFLAKFNLLKTPLQRMACGGFLTALAFVVTAGVSFALEATYPNLPDDGQCQLRVYNPFNDCDAILKIPDYNISTTLTPMSYQYININNVQKENNVTFTIEKCINDSGIIPINEKTGIVYWVTENGFLGQEDNIDKPENGFPVVRTLVANPTIAVSNLTYYDGKDKALSVNSTDTTLNSIDPGTFKLGNTEVKFELGAVYTVLVKLYNDTTIEVKF